MAERFFDQKPDFKDLIVTVLMRNFIHEEAYKKAFEKAEEEFKRDKKEFSEDFISSLIDFLNHWSCMVDDETEENIKATLNRNIEDIKVLRTKNYVDFLENQASEQRNIDRLKRLFEELYSNETKGVKLTIASKVLHILLPNLVVMIDGSIEDKFKDEYKKMTNKKHMTSVCFEFQEEMWKWAKDIKKGHWDKLEEVLREAGVEYWNELKLIDAYNWLRITQGINFERIKEIIKNYFCTLE